MKKNLLVIAFISFAAFIVFYRAFLNFFAQDDFILISQFSGHGYFVDLLRTFGPPQVTHWRPVHNFYFLISGYLFGKDVFWYHFLTFIIQVMAGFFIFKALKAINLNGKAAAFAALLYVVNPSHFNTYYWISGGATAIGFCFFVISFYFYVRDKKVLSILFFLISLLASEAMIVGLLVIFSYEMLFGEKWRFLKSNLPLFVSSLFFIVVKIVLTPKNTFDVYKIELSAAIVGAFKFYMLRTFGFAGVSNDGVLTAILLIWIFIAAIWFVSSIKKDSDFKFPTFFFLVIVIGLFPFVLIPSHLSSNYINVSIFGISALAGLIFSKIKTRYAVLMLIAFIFISFFSVRLIEQDNWVMKRARLASFYLGEIEKSNPPMRSILVFNDNYISSSYDAYIALGAGDAINFWFKGKEYKTCFSAFENCGNLP